MGEVRVIHASEDDLRRELEQLYRAYPDLRDPDPTCCSGCVDVWLAARWGWDSPIIPAGHRVEEIRFLLGEGRRYETDWEHVE